MSLFYGRLIGNSIHFDKHVFLRKLILGWEIFALQKDDRDTRLKINK